MATEKEAFLGALAARIGSQAARGSARNLGRAAGKFKLKSQAPKLQATSLKPTTVPAGTSVTQATNPVRNAASKATPKINPYRPPTTVPFGQPEANGLAGLNTRLLSQLRGRPSSYTYYPSRSRYRDLRSIYRVGKSEPQLIRNIGNSEIPGFPTSSIAQFLIRHRKGLRKAKDRAAGTGGLLAVSSVPTVEQAVADQRGTESYTKQIVKAMLNSLPPR